MKISDQITAAAVIGSGQQEWQTPASPALDAVRTALEQQPVEQRLLHAASLVVLFETAGAKPARAVIAPQALPEPDATPVCGTRFTSGLRQMLAGVQDSCWSESLELLRTHGKRIPAELVPAALELATRSRGLRFLTRALTGTLGRWLAAQNENWQWATGGEPDEAVWHTGAAEERLHVLGAIRKQDPARARELVAGSWESEKSEDRKAFLDVLGERLSLDDEAFLEAALDDRAITVRRAAADLLSGLAGSAFRDRMRGYAKDLIALNARGMLRQKTAELNLPAACTREMERDGVEPKPPKGQSIGERQWWALMILSRTPLAYWTEKWNTNAESLIVAARRGDDHELLLDGWAAAARPGDAEWATALLAVRSREDEHRQKLFQILPVAAREQELASRMENLNAVVGHARHPWSRGFTQRFLEAYRKQTAGAPDWQLGSTRPLVRTAAAHAHPETNIEAEPDSPLAEFAAIVAFRRLMHEAILETN